MHSINWLVKEYKHAQDSRYNFSDRRQRRLLAECMEWIKLCQAQNKRRIVFNIYGPKGSGKEYMKSMLINYLRLKKVLTTMWCEVTQDMDYVNAQKTVRAGYSLVVADTKFWRVTPEELVQLIEQSNNKLIILSDSEVPMKDIKHF